MRQLTQYAIHTGKLSSPKRIIVVSDLHDGSFEDILPMLQGADALLVPGDIVNRYRQGYARGVAFLQTAAERLPTYFGVGNHEMRLKHPSAFWNAVGQTTTHVLFNEYLRLGELVIGCWYRPERYGHTDMIPRMAEEPGVRILMSHRPEDYYRYLQNAPVDLILAGHAHGGQIRIAGQGLYAPGQGILPKLTHGLVDGRMVISAGATNAVPVPRWGNPCEVLAIDLD